MNRSYHVIVVLLPEPVLFKWHKYGQARTDRQTDTHARARIHEHIHNPDPLMNSQDSALFIFFTGLLH